MEKVLNTGKEVVLDCRLKVSSQKKNDGGVRK